MRMKRLWISVSVMLLLLMSVSVALAKPTWKDRREAQKLGREAKELLQKGDAKQAAKRYAKADELIPAPSYKLGLAKALIELGDLIRAAEVLRAAAESKPRQFAEKQATKKAATLLEEVDERTPTLEIAVYDPEASETEITVDGEEFDVGDGAVEYNPGKYEVLAKAEGYEDWTAKLDLQEGDVEALEITMKSLSGDGGDEADDGGGGGMDKLPAYIAWGTGAVGIGVGIGFGIAAIQSTNDVLQYWDCKDGVCPPAAEDDLNTAKMNGHISTVGWVVGAVGIAAVSALGAATW